jgi:UPF0755 protein
MQKKFGKILLVLLLLIASCVLWVTWQWRVFLTTPMLAKGHVPIAFEIKPGTSLPNVATQLNQQGVLTDTKRFLQLAGFRGAYGKIKAGEYLIAPGKTTPWQFLTNIMSGKVMMRSLTIVEGWTFAQLMAAVNNNLYLQHTLLGLDPQAVMTQLGYPNINPEGQFYPDTYLFNKGTSDKKILRIAYQKMQTLINKSWQGRAANLPYQDAYQALIAASLIEKETADANERPLIAGVILNRLNINMRLQIDPTVIYAMGPLYDGKLTHKNMRIDSPYNTYRNKGLPPTPIAIPSPSSLYAALHPAKTDAIYYVSTRDGNHKFTTTLVEHDVAIKKYLLSPRFCSAPILLFQNCQQAL